RRCSGAARGLWRPPPTLVRCLGAASGRAALSGLVVRGRGFQAAVPGPGGGLLAVLDNAGITVWDTTTGNRADVSSPRAPSAGAVTFSPDGTALLAADPAGVGARLWDVGVGRPIG